MLGKIKKNKWYQKTVCLFLSGVCAISMLSVAYGATGQKESVTVKVEGYSGEASALRILADTSSFDESGNAVVTKGDQIPADFVKENDVCTAQAELYRSVRYYLSDGVEGVTFVPEQSVCKVSFNGSDTSASVSQNSSGAPSGSQVETVAAPAGFGVSATSPKAVTEGDVLKCVITSLSNASDVDSDHFLLQCEVPDGTVLESIYTGTYNEEVRMELVCQTEKDKKWHDWGEQISSKTGETFKTDTITFAEGDRIGTFALSASEVPKGFSMNKDDPLCYYVRIVDAEKANGYSGLARFTAYMDGKKSASEASFTTAIRKNVQTGDENALLIGSSILLVLSFLCMMGFILFRVISYYREKKARKERLPEFYSVMSGGTETTMGDLMKRR